MREKFLEWKEVFERKELKVNFKKVKVIVSGSKRKILDSKINSCVKWGKRVMQV